jgi:hypothetical protein
MKNAWLTYSWKNNEAEEVDYITKQLEQSGIKVKLDRTELIAGARFWPQIEKKIGDPKETDGLILYATEHSFLSEPCREEFYYALQRAHETNGNYPIIALFQSKPDFSNIPLAVKTRLCVTLCDQDWVERVKSGLEKRRPNIEIKEPLPFHIAFFPADKETGCKFMIELGPRIGIWSPFKVGIPLVETESVNPRLRHGPRGHRVEDSALFNYEIWEHQQASWYSAANEANQHMSYFLLCDAMPTNLIFGTRNGGPLYLIKGISSERDANLNWYVIKN